VFIVLTLFAEAALLVVAAQAGFLDGPRVLANMAVDSWVPHRFAALSDRLTAHNGIVVMGLAALAALLYTGGSVGHLVVMYSINVFLTFTLSMLSMLRYWRGERARPESGRRLALFGAGFLLCVTILLVTVFEKFADGGWLTVVITLVLVALCLLIRRHYHGAAATVDKLYRQLGDLPIAEGAAPVPPDPRSPVAPRQPGPTSPPTAGPMALAGPMPTAWEATRSARGSSTPRGGARSRRAVAAPSTRGGTSRPKPCGRSPPADPSDRESRRTPAIRPRRAS
jgi:hypothetical protein